jgi:uncharacterized protein YcbK (DUF882 family)
MKKTLLVLVVLVLAGSGYADSNGRFFLEGDGTIRLTNPKNGRSEEISYRGPDGSYSDEAHQQTNAVFGLEAKETLEDISLRFIALLDYIQDNFGEGRKVIQLNSAYRSPQYNQSLRKQGRTVAKASTHMEGMAADIEIKGVDGKYLWESLRAKNCCGVGWYGKNSVHVDTGPARFWTGATSKVDTDISTNNKKVLLRTDRDIYRIGEPVTMRLGRVTLYPIGVRSEFQIISVDAAGKERTLEKFQPQFANLHKDQDGKCVKIHERSEALGIVWQIPERLKFTKDPLYIKVEFCEKAHPEVPDKVLSNHIEIR